MTLSRSLLAPLSIACVGSLAACSGGGGGGGALEWRGAETHFVLQGNVGGRELDLDLTAADAEISCEREYIVPLVDGVEDPSMAQYVETEVTVVLNFEGQEYEFQVELKEHDLQNATIGGDITVVPRVDTETPAATEAWLELEWESADETDVFEQAAQQGTVTLELFSGTPGDDTPIIPEGDGSVGFTAVADWSATERLELSITAPCLTNDVETVE